MNAKYLRRSTEVDVNEIIAHNGELVKVLHVGDTFAGDGVTNVGRFQPMRVQYVGSGSVAVWFLRTTTIVDCFGFAA